MPVYDYRCTSCETRFEVNRPMGATAQGTCCPSCGEEAKRVFTPVGVAFKGSGFHNTDYKPSGKDAAASSSGAVTGGGCPSAKEGGGCAGCPAAS